MIESYSYWLAVTFYALATVTYIVSLIFKKERYLKWATALILFALISHSLSIVLRWIRVGHGPYLNTFEVLSSDSWIAVAVFLLAQWKWPKIRWIGSVIAAVVFLTLGLGATFSKEVQYLSPTLQSYWLMVHIFFAKLAYGSFLLTFALALFYLYKERRRKYPEKDQKLVDSLPVLDTLDELSYRFAALGFVFTAIMIITGAIWANNAWGRYWAWDPIETWALVTWFVYGIFLHLRITYRWKGNRSAWYLVGAILVVVLAFFIVPHISKSIHAVYFTS